jgi:intracellular sulfur oxidation DsrE/DsrF family protein
MVKDSKKIKTIISCIYDGSPIPIGFSWANTLATRYECKYKQTVLLHGECLKYGLNSDVYQSIYGTPNPSATLLQQFVEQYKIKVVICELCLNNEGFNNSQLLPFIKPVPFSIDFIAESQAKEHAVVIYDAQLSQ